jgi:hypothetical protein
MENISTEFCINKNNIFIFTHYKQYRTIYYQDPNIVIKLSLTDGFAYFAEIGDYPVQPKIVLTDLKEIIEEWIEFRYTSYKVS